MMMTKGPFCQSCGMPLDKAELFGTCADGTRSTEYCTYCYQNGKFTEPTITMDMMIEKCIDIVVRRRMLAEAQARPAMLRTIPLLRRWRKD